MTVAYVKTTVPVTRTVRSVNSTKGGLSVQNVKENSTARMHTTTSATKMNLIVQLAGAEKWRIKTVSHATGMVWGETMIRWTSKRIPGDRNDKDEASIEFEGTRGEIDALDNALSTGQLWVRKDEAGNLIFAPSFKKPELGTDYDVEPYFTKGKKIARLARGLLKKDETDRSDCSVFAQHICGYGGNYEERARRLENAGFSCLRSRRGKDGKYW